MIDVYRLRELSGMHPQHKMLAELQADKAATMALYDQLIIEAQQNVAINEGLFTALKATLANVGQLGAAGAKSKETKPVDEAIKRVYKNPKIVEELDLLIKNVKAAITTFETIEKDAAEIIKSDPEIAKEMKLFNTLFEKLLETLSSRLVIAKGG